MCIRTIWGRLPSKAEVISFAGLSCLSLLLLLQVLLQASKKPACPPSQHFYWVITSSKLHLVNRVALESIFLHHPTDPYFLNGRHSSGSETVCSSYSFCFDRGKCINCRFAKDFPNVAAIPLAWNCLSHFSFGFVLQFFFEVTIFCNFCAS